jgi:hypothetical protein
MYNPFKPFLPEIIDRVIRPKVDQILSTRPHEIRKKSDLTLIFNDEFDTKISENTMNTWLDLMGYQTSHKFTIETPIQNRPDPPPLSPTPRPRPVPGVGGLLGTPFAPPH